MKITHKNSMRGIFITLSVAILTVSVYVAVFFYSKEQEKVISHKRLHHTVRCIYTVNNDRVCKHSFMTKEVGGGVSLCTMDSISRSVSIPCESFDRLDKLGLRSRK